MTKTSLVLFTRDLRLADNLTLAAVKYAIIPAFIIDETLLGSHHNLFAQRFMLESLLGLDDELAPYNSALDLRQGKFTQEFTALLDEHSPAEVLISNDHTPYAKKRAALIAKLCVDRKIPLHCVDNHWLLPFDHSLKADKTPYTVFTPFYKHGNGLEIPPANATQLAFITREQEHSRLTKITEATKMMQTLKGGRAEALSILYTMTDYTDYLKKRDFPAQTKGTTSLSAHLHWGTIGPRELYWAIADVFDIYHPLIRQLWWREFYSAIAYHFPHVWRQNYQTKYDQLEWSDDTLHWQAWLDGQTGFPLVDAGMRQLKQTGQMHNRVRMVVGSFLTKDLHIDWRWGEKYFAERLVDYDKAVNNGNWQWVASTGTDAQPYFRIFNPWLQQAKFDSEASYIKEWVPELVELSSKEIHDPLGVRPNYPEPIIDHRTESRLTLEYYTHIAKNS